MLRAAALACCLAFGATAEAGTAPDASAPVCHSKPDSPDVIAARAALAADSTLLTARFDLANGLQRQGCFQEAVTVLEAGQTAHPRDVELQNRLRVARSQITEQEYFAGLASAQEDAKFKRALLRCQKLNDIKACDEAVATQPTNVDLLSYKSDALVALHRPAEAIPVLRQARTIDGNSESIRTKLQSAEAQRAQFLERCKIDAGDAALSACQAALLRGESDEFEIQSRRGALLQESNRTSAALDAYIAAGTLRPNDRAVALAIVALTESTARRDPVALQARKVARDTVTVATASATTSGSSARVAREPRRATFASNAPVPIEPKKVYSNKVTDGRAH